MNRSPVQVCRGLSSHTETILPVALSSFFTSLIDSPFRCRSNSSFLASALSCAYVFSLEKKVLLTCAQVTPRR